MKFLSTYSNFVNEMRHLPTDNINSYSNVIKNTEYKALIKLGCTDITRDLRKKRGNLVIANPFYSNVIKHNINSIDESERRIVKEYLNKNKLKLKQFEFHKECRQYYIIRNNIGEKYIDSPAKYSIQAFDSLFQSSAHKITYEKSPLYGTFYIDTALTKVYNDIKANISKMNEAILIMHKLDPKTIEDMKAYNILRKLFPYSYQHKINKTALDASFALGIF